MIIRMLKNFLGAEGFMNGIKVTLKMSNDARISNDA